MAAGPNPGKTDQSRFPASVYQELIGLARQLHSERGAPLSNIPEHAAKLTEDIIRLAHGDVRLKLGMAAKELDIPLRTLERHFQRIYLSTPKAYQIRVRIEWACELIRRHPLQKLDSIAMQMGYHDVSDFARLFRNKLGVSPQEYRNSLKRK